jgi:hypothetical protein
MCRLQCSGFFIVSTDTAVAIFSIYTFGAGLEGLTADGGVEDEAAIGERGAWFYPIEIEQVIGSCYWRDRSAVLSNRNRSRDRQRIGTGETFWQVDNPQRRWQPYVTLTLN